MKILKTITIILVICMLISGLVFVIRDEGRKVDTLVELVDGSEYRCTAAYSYNDGMTMIVRPNGTDSRIWIPTRRIKIIKKII